MKFIADSMLGRLAGWLRVLGYDTYYQSCYRPGDIDRIVKDNRRLLSRHRKTADRYDNAVFLCSTRVGEQLAELKDKIGLAPDRSGWFSRCLLCNVLLEPVQFRHARDNIPDYIFYQYGETKRIRVCPSCGRYYWPGSHRTRMLRQLADWGF